MKHRLIQVGYGIIGALALLVAIEMFKDLRFLHAVRLQSEQAQPAPAPRRPTPPQTEP